MPDRLEVRWRLWNKSFAKLSQRFSYGCRICKKSVIVCSPLGPSLPSFRHWWREQKSLTVRSVDSYLAAIENTASITHRGRDAYSYAAPDGGVLRSSSEHRI